MSEMIGINRSEMMRINMNEMVGITMSELLGIDREITVTNVSEIILLHMNDVTHPLRVMAQESIKCQN